MDTITGQIKRRIGGGSYEKKYTKVDTYCPNCGKQSVFEADGEGDYYVGPDCVCLECDSVFTWQGASKADQFVLEQLKAH